MNVCRRWKEPIHLLVSGRLEEPSLSALRIHMEQCDACRGFCEDLHKIEAVLRSPVPVGNFLPAPEIRAIVERSLNQAQGKSIPVRGSITVLKGWKLAWGFAAAALLFLGGYLFRDLSAERAATPLIASTTNVPATDHSMKKADLPKLPAGTDSGSLVREPSARSGAAQLSKEELAAERHYAIANRLRKDRNYAGAAAALQKFLALHAVKHERALLDLAYCYGMLDQPQKALPIYRAVAKGSRNPRFVETAYNRIDSLLDPGPALANVEGIEVPARSISNGRWDRQGRYYLVQMPIRKEDSAKADCLLEQFRREFPHSNQTPGMSPQIINVGSPYVVNNRE